MTSQPPSESDPKGVENEAPEDKVTRGNFEALARGLFRVTPEQFANEEARQKEQRRYEAKVDMTKSLRGKGARKG